MNKDKTQIKIPEIGGEVQIKIPDIGGTLTADEVKKDADSKFKDINYILLSVVIVLLVMVATLVIDSFHINSATYKEYAQKTESVEMIQKANEALLEQMRELSEQNKQNQMIIIEQQKQIIEILNKK